MGRLLLAWGADPNAAQSGWDATPLFYTCWDGHAEFARMLLAHGADVNRIADDRHVLPFATGHGHTELVAAFVEAGANLEATEADFGCTALHLAALRGYAEIAEILLEAGAPIDHQNRLGESPLVLAGRYGHRDVVELLRARGARGRVPESHQGLSAFTNLPEQEAAVWFLGHSGWGIKTKNHMLIFDYFERNRQPGQPGLCNGHIVPQELAGENVTVLVSHVHGDHYDPRIWEWREGIPKITYVCGFEPEGDEIPAYELIGPRQTRTYDGVKVTAIESNDTGVGFWVEVDGLTIFHPGDHANRQRDFSGPYKAEIDWLAETGVKPDIAFFPISGCGFGDLEAVKMGVHYAIETLEPRVFFPMHAGDITRRYETFIEECRAQFPNTRMEAAVVRGDRFHYSNGNVAALASRVD
jgi:L-ascorbate metabolism protein UlaG (beta-lactamase superfamily)